MGCLLGPVSAYAQLTIAIQDNSGQPEINILNRYTAPMTAFVATWTTQSQESTRQGATILLDLQISVPGEGGSRQIYIAASHLTSGPMSKRR